MKILIENLNDYFGDDIETLACCCGHGKYNMSLIVKQCFPEAREKFQIYDWCSGKYIPRKKRFYVKDKQGYYYIPETVLPTKHNTRLKILKHH